MCGFAGFTGHPHKDWAADIERMTDALAHRGPDDSGTWAQEQVQLYFGHRRLSILDLSPLGHQPMHSASGRFTIIYNGEIYNFADLRSELEKGGHQFRGGSDTEVMLAAFEEWGVETALARFNGMFAFAVWDDKEQQLSLARDRLGIKPLFYGWNDGRFFFGSELKAFTAHPGFREEISRAAVAAQMRFSYVPAPYSIYEGMYKLPQGSFLQLSPEQFKSPPSDFSPMPQQSSYSPQYFWSSLSVANHGLNGASRRDSQETLEEFERLLLESVKMRMIADVPLGAFLSGGIDSSAVVALMQAQSTRPVKTFSIGFDEERYNEAKFAKAVAEHLGTDHEELYVSPQQALEVIPLLPRMYDEPFSDSSQIPTFLVSKLARQHVTVSLSGDGGDELFGGYNRYQWGSKIWRAIGWLPAGLRYPLGQSLRALRPTQYEAIFDRLRPILPGSLNFHNPGDKIHKLARVLRVKNFGSLYHSLVSHWEAPTELVRQSEELPTIFSRQDLWLDKRELFTDMMYWDMVSYLPDDILVKVDRASMARSLEARVPLLDHRVVEFAWTVPLSMKVRGGKGKWLLRQLLYKYVPAELVERPKTGFGIPIDHWLRSSLRDWAEELLDSKKLEEQGIFDTRFIRQKWDEHLSGKHNWQAYLWDVLMFQAWYDARKGESGL